jgi:hypothetical protein
VDIAPCVPLGDLYALECNNAESVEINEIHSVISQKIVLLINKYADTNLLGKYFGKVATYRNRLLPKNVDRTGSDGLILLLRHLSEIEEVSVAV